MLAVFAACAFLLRQQRRHYESLLRDARADNRDLRDRLFASKNLPPVGVDLKAEHEERKAERKERQNDKTLKSAPDPMWGVRQDLALREKKRIDKQK
jgi:hypothetical protein